MAVLCAFSFRTPPLHFLKQSTNQRLVFGFVFPRVERAAGRVFSSHLFLSCTPNIKHIFTIMGLNDYSDYSSASSSEQYSPWSSQDIWSMQAGLQETELPSRTRSSSFIERVSKGVDAVMQEFRMNGSDSPYDPDEELTNQRVLMGMGPSSAYLRQKSWPAPDSTPAMRLPTEWRNPSAAEMLLAAKASEAPKQTESVLNQEAISEQQLRVLRSLPNAVLYPLLRELEQTRLRGKGRKQAEEQECRFCKNNGERESYYRSHSLRAGGRVACPVLRAFVCRRCGARGDGAHTLKYCPLTTADERMKSAAMMRSVRMSNRRRLPTDEYVVFGQATPAVLADGSACTFETAPLDPIWAALEQKLML